MISTATHSPLPKSQQWYRPTVSPEHGVYVMLLVSFLTGAAAAQQWTWGTTLALICGFCGFQAEYPLIWQVRQRKRLQLRLLLWASLYSLVAVAIGRRLALRDRPLASLASFRFITTAANLPWSDRSFNFRHSFSLASSTKITAQRIGNIYCRLSVSPTSTYCQPGYHFSFSDRSLVASTLPI